MARFTPYSQNPNDVNQAHNTLVEQLNKFAAIAWTSANDGSGSGLDADTVDTFHAASMYPLAQSVSGAGSIDLNTLYGLSYSNYRKYLWNTTNGPVNQMHGYLECLYYNGTGFNPAGLGACAITIQRFTQYWDDSIWRREYRSDIASWSPWWTGVYPVGSIYQSTTKSTSPADMFGGTWAELGGKFLVGFTTAAGTFHTAGATGGAETHTLATTEIPAHNHSIDPSHVMSQVGADDWQFANGSGGEQALKLQYTQAIANTGGGGAHNNLPPYKVVYIWERTA